MTDIPATDDLAEEQVRAVEALVGGATLAVAAAAAGVSERTLRRWRRQLRFREAVRMARRDAFADGIAAIRSALMEAARALRAVASDVQAPAQARVNAARAIIDTALRSVDLVESVDGRQEADLLLTGTWE